MPKLQKSLLGYIFDEANMYRRPVTIDTFNDLAKFLMEAGKSESHARITTTADEYIWDSDELDTP